MEDKKDVTVKQLLEEWVIKNQEESKLRHKPLKDNEFYASAAGMCPRVMYFDKKYGRKEPGMKVQKIFVLGNLVHEFVQDNLLKHGESESPAVLESNGIVVRGRLDHLDDDFIWELKSIANLRYVQDKPKIENVYQIMIYLKALGRTKGKLVYIEKNTFDIVEHIVEFDEFVLKDSISAFVKTHEGLKNNKTPAGISNDQSNWKCRYCDWFDKCVKCNL